MGKKSAAMHNQTYLLRRDGTYYFRAKIPTDLRPFQYRGNTYPVEYKRSLQTKDRAEALRLLRKEILEITTEFEKYRDRIAQGRGEIEPRKVLHLDLATQRQLATRWLHEVLATDEALRREAETVQELTKHIAQTKKLAKRASEAYARRDVSFLEEDMKRMLGTFGAEVSVDEQSYRDLQHQFLSAAAIYAETLTKRNHGAVVETEDVAPEHAAWTLPTRRPGGDSLEALLEYWVRAVSDRRATTVAAFKSTMEQFASYVHNKAPSMITRSDLTSFRDHLRTTFTSKKKAPHPNTIEKKLTFLNAIFQRAVDDGLLPANPAARIKVQKPKVDGAPPRLPYDHDDLTRIFASPLYTKRHRPRGCGGEAAVWLPLLGAFTGARLEELGQLHVEDIKRDPKLGWYIEIGLAKGRRVKTNSSRRRVPVHRELIKAGFLRYRDTLLLANQPRVFPDLKVDCKGDLTGNWSKWWGRYSHNYIKITDPSRVFHSFRHSFVECFRAAQAGDEEIRHALTGHVFKGEGRKYGGALYPLPPLFAAMERYSLPDVATPIVVPDPSGANMPAAKVEANAVLADSSRPGKVRKRVPVRTKVKSLAPAQRRPTSRKRAKSAATSKASRKRAS